MNQPTPDTPTETLETRCPRCGRNMALPLPFDLYRAIAERLARFVLCHRCSDHGPELLPQEPPSFRLPYVD